MSKAGSFERAVTIIIIDCYLAVAMYVGEFFHVVGNSLEYWLRRSNGTTFDVIPTPKRSTLKRL